MEENQITDSFSSSGSGNIMHHFPVMPISLFYPEGHYTSEHNLHISGNNQCVDKSPCESKNKTNFQGCCEEDMQNIPVPHSEQHDKFSATRNTENFKRFSVDNLLQIADLRSGKHTPGKVLF